LLVLGAGPAQLGLLAAAHRRDRQVIAVDRDPDAPGFRYADRRAIISTEDELGIERLADAERVDGIIAPGIDWPVGIAARVAAKLGLPHPLSPESGVLATSKARQRERPAFGVALAHTWPSAQPTPQIARAIDAARQAAAALGIAEGPTYTQVLVSDDGAVVGELAARLGGGHDAELCRAALRVNLNQL